MLARIHVLRALSVFALALALGVAVEVVVSGASYAMHDVTIEFPSGVSRLATFADGAMDGLRRSRSLLFTAPVAFTLAVIASTLSARLLSAAWLGNALVGLVAGALGSFVVYLVVGGWGPPNFFSAACIGAVTGAFHRVYMKQSSSPPHPPA